MLQYSMGLPSAESKSRQVAYPGIRAFASIAMPILTVSLLYWPVAYYTSMYSVQYSTSTVATVLSTRRH